MKEKIKAILRALLHAVSQNLGWKIFSLVAAILLWSYIVTSDPTITRDKSIADVEITVSGQSVLQSRDLALLTDPSEQLVRVRVAAPRANYSRVTGDSVRVELDLSQIRQTGKQEVELKGYSNYGEVIQISPSRMEIVVETLDARNVPVNVNLTGYKKDSQYWYDVVRTNPSTITVSGPSSIVQNISAAQVNVDVTGATSDYTWTVAPELLDANGESIDQMLSKSSSSVSVGLAILPVKQLTVANSIETTITGELPDGYSVTRVEVEPEIVLAAAEQELLDQLETVTFNPIMVAGRTRSFTATAKLNKLNNVEHLSTEQVTVTIYIEENIESRTFKSVPLGVLGKGIDQTIKLSEDKLNVKVTGLHTVFDKLMRGDIIARVDVTGLSAGTYELPVTITVDNYTDLTFELESPTVTVTISE